jgi:hypothetical protein
VAADRYNLEQIGRVLNAAHKKQPLNSYLLRRACPEIQELYLIIQGIQDRLSWALDYDSADAIESHHQALLSKVRRIEGAATREAKVRGWDFIEIEDL